MKPLPCNARAWLVTAFLAILAPRLARGDGGIIQLRESQGPFTVTVFTSPEAARGGLADVSVLVQWRTNGEVVLDADVSLAVVPPDGLATARPDPFCGLTPNAAALALPDLMEHDLTVRATRERASNKLLYAADLKLNGTGNWRLRVDVSHGSDRARFACQLPATHPSSGLAEPWPYLILPPIVIVAFAINQWLRRHSLERALKPF